jgi:hypothetical protein
MSTVFEKLLSGEWPCAKVYEDELGSLPSWTPARSTTAMSSWPRSSRFETLLDMDEDDRRSA